MFRVLKFSIAVLIAFLPSILKIRILNMMGHSISSSSKIGFSILDVDHISMKANTYIGHGNVFKNLPRLEMEEGSRINRWNKITSNAAPKSKLRLMNRASISLRHYLDVCDLIEIGNDTIIAGQNSTFFTHSKGIDVIDFARPILIGNWCYLGSGLNVSPGTVIGSNCFVGMGAVLSGNKANWTYALIVGNPAIKKKDLDPDSAYFQQQALVHAHTAPRK